MGLLSLRAVALALLSFTDVHPIRDGQQTPAVGPSALSGRVLDDRTGQPVAGALVTLVDRGASAASSSAPAPAMTDELGRFVFPALQSSSAYHLRASRPGYADGVFSDSGRASALGDPIVLEHGQWIDAISIRLARAASIFGTVRDAHGEPVAGALVRAGLRVTVAGRTRTVLGPPVRADTEGRYRLSSIAAGRYVVMVSSVQATVVSDEGLERQLKSQEPSSHPLPILAAGKGTGLLLGRVATPGAAGHVYRPAFHPGESRTDLATEIVLDSGEHRRGVDVILRSERAYRVTGRVTGADPDRLRDSFVMLRPSEGDEGLGFECATATIAADGRFVLLNVAAGEYVLTVTPSVNELALTRHSLSLSFPSASSVLPPGLGSGFLRFEVLGQPWMSASLVARGTAAQGVWGQRCLRVHDGDLEDVVVAASTTGSVRGHVRFEDATLPAGVPRMLALRTDPADASLDRTVTFQPVAPGGGPVPFSLDGLSPGGYFLRLDTPGVNVRSILWRGQDVSGRPFTISGDIADEVDVIVAPVDAHVVTGRVSTTEPARGPGGMVVYLPAPWPGRNGLGWAPPRIGAVPIVDGAYTIRGLPPCDYVLVARR